jgi:hypothetical protein
MYRLHERVRLDLLDNLNDRLDNSLAFLFLGVLGLQAAQGLLEAVDHLRVRTPKACDREESYVLDEQLVYWLLFKLEERFAVHLLEMLARYLGQQLLHEVQPYLPLLR